MKGALELLKPYMENDKIQSLSGKLSLERLKAICTTSGKTS